MDGVHDMGGMDGFGKVEPEPNEPVFHHRWEGRVLAMSRAIGVFRAWTIDSSRYAIELMAPSIYLTRSYYEKWFLRNQNLLIERGLIDADEVAAGRALRPAKNLTRGRFTLADVEKVTKRGSYSRPAPAAASACTARTSFPTPRLPVKAKIRSGFIRFVSMLKSFGARTRTQS